MFSLAGFHASLYLIQRMYTPRGFMPEFRMTQACTLFRGFLPGHRASERESLLFSRGFSPDVAEGMLDMEYHYRPLGDLVLESQHKTPRTKHNTQ
jgi:hypothetical protein